MPLHLLPVARWRAVLKLIALAIVGVGVAATAPDWSQCAVVIPIPGNPNGVTNCATCNNGASPWYPCNDPSLCYCQGSTIPPEYVLPFTYCDSVIAVPGNGPQLKDADCAKCHNANYRYWPCDRANVGVLCRCATTPTTGVTADPTETATATPTPPPVTTTTTLAPNSPTLAPPSGPWADCDRVIAIPGNTQSVGDGQCAVCARGAASWWPCNTPGLCYCASGTIPPEYRLPFWNCSQVVAVADQLGATDAQCATCSMARSRWWPCGAEQVGVLCICATDVTPAPTAAQQGHSCTLPLPELGDPLDSSSAYSTATRAMPLYTSELGANAARIQRLMNESVFQELFPRANNGAGPQATPSGPYTYSAFLRAASRYPDFCGSKGPLRSDLAVDDVCLLELATFLAHVGHETGEANVHIPTPIWLQGLYHSEEPACAGGNGGPACAYADSADLIYPPVPGRQYYGRGALMLSNSHAYGAFSASVYGDAMVLLRHPEYLASADPRYSWLAFASALWLYITPKGPMPSMHDVVTGHWVPSPADDAAGRGSSFGTTTLILHGDCDSNSTALQPREEAFLGICDLLGVSCAPLAPTGCHMEPFSEVNRTVPSLYWDADSTSPCRCRLVPWETKYFAAGSPNLSVPYLRCVNAMEGGCPLCAIPAVPSDYPVGPFGDTMASFGVGVAPVCTPTARPAGCTAPDYAYVLCLSASFYMVQAGGRNVAGQEWRQTCFPNDGSEPSPPTGPTANLSLGWLDAGDTVKFGLPMAYSAMALAWGALEFPDGYAPGSEQRAALLYNLRTFVFYILAGWDPVTKELVAQIGQGERDHNSWMPCYTRTDSRPVWRISPTCPGTEVAADTASALAAIAILLRRFEGDVSAALQQQLAEAATQLFDLADTYRGKYTGCVTDAVGYYESYSGFYDELTLAATWMRSLQLEGFINDDVDYIAKAKSTYSWPNNIDWDNKQLAATLRLYALTRDSSYRTAIITRVNWYMTGADRTTGGLIRILRWGVLRHAINAAFSVRLGYKLGLGNATWIAFAQQQLDYALGMNPAGRSYVGGFGVNPPVRQHHRNAHDNLDGYLYDPSPNKHVLYGALSGGPWEDDYDFTDSRENYVQAEVGTDYNALFSGLLASFNGLCTTNTTVQTPPPTPVPPPTPAPIVQYTAELKSAAAWWVEVIVSPRPTTATMYYNEDLSVAMSIPTWGHLGSGDIWVASPPVAVDPASEIVVVLTDSSDVTTVITVKEGTLHVTVTLLDGLSRRQADSSAEPIDMNATIQGAASRILGIDAKRIKVVSVSATEAHILIYPLPMVYYTMEGRERSTAPGADPVSHNSAVVAKLNDTTSTERAKLLRAIGGVHLRVERVSTRTSERKERIAAATALALGVLVVVGLACLAAVLIRRRRRPALSKASVGPESEAKSGTAHGAPAAVERL